MEKLNNLSDVRRVARQTGNHFFDAEAMRFFNSRICEARTRTTFDGTVWFITSERYDDDPRIYNVRRASVAPRIDKQGSDFLDIETVSYGHVSADAAERAMLKAIREAN